MLAAAGAEMATSVMELATPTPTTKWPDRGTLKTMIDLFGEHVENLDAGRSPILTLWKEYGVLMDLAYESIGAPNAEHGKKHNAMGMDLVKIEISHYPCPMLVRVVALNRAERCTVAQRKAVDDLLIYLYQEYCKRPGVKGRKKGTVHTGIAGAWARATSDDDQIHVRAELLKGLEGSKEPKITKESITNMLEDSSPQLKRHTSGEALELTLAMRRFGKIIQDIMDSAPTKAEGDALALKAVEEQVGPYTEMIGTTPDGSGGNGMLHFIEGGAQFQVSGNPTGSAASPTTHNNQVHLQGEMPEFGRLLKSTTDLEGPDILYSPDLVRILREGLAMLRRSGSTTQAKPEASPKRLSLLAGLASMRGSVDNKGTEDAARDGSTTRGSIQTSTLREEPVIITTTGHSTTPVNQLNDSGVQLPRHPSDPRGDRLEQRVGGRGGDSTLHPVRRLVEDITPQPEHDERKIQADADRDARVKNRNGGGVGESEGTHLLFDEASSAGSVGPGGGESPSRGQYDREESLRVKEECERITSELSTARTRDGTNGMTSAILRVIVTLVSKLDGYHQLTGSGQTRAGTEGGRLAYASVLLAEGLYGSMRGLQNIGDLNRVCAAMLEAFELGLCPYVDGNGVMQQPLAETDYARACLLMVLTKGINLIGEQCNRLTSMQTPLTFPECPYLQVLCMGRVNHVMIQEALDGSAKLHAASGYGVNNVINPTLKTIGRARRPGVGSAGGGAGAAAVGRQGAPRNGEANGRSRGRTQGHVRGARGVSGTPVVVKAKRNGTHLSSLRVPGGTSGPTGVVNLRGMCTHARCVGIRTGARVR